MSNTIINTTSPSITKVRNKTWILAFVFSFLAFIVDGADLLLLSLSLTSLETEWGLSQVQKGMLGTLTLLGMTVGGVTGGWAADRYGRVRTAVVSILVFSVGTAILGATQSYLQFATLRFASSLGIGALYISCAVLMSEYVPTKYRTTVLGTLQAGWSVGYILATLLAGWIIPNHGWRWLYYIAIVPAALAVALQLVVPEPDSWIASRAKKAEEEKNNLAKADVDRPKRENVFKTIFANKQSRNLFILWGLTSGFLQFGYYGVNNWMPNYLERDLGMDFKAMSFFLVGTYISMVFGKIIAGVIADIIGRRIVYSVGAIGTAIFLPIIVLYHTPENILYLLMAFGFLYGIPYAINGAYMAESFATNIRGSAVGGAYNIGRVGSAMAPVIIGFIALQFSIGAGFLLLGVAFFFCGLIPALFIKDKLYDPQK